MIVPDVVQVDAAREPLNVLANNLRNIASNGIWLSPYRGIPQADWTPDLDIVYIDPHFRVLRCIEGYRQGSMTLPEISADSALVLPSGRVSSARIQFGDKLELRDAATGNRWGGHTESTEDDLQSQPKPQAQVLKRVFGWLFGSKEEPKQSDRRKAERHAIPGLVAYFSISSNRRPFDVKSISTEGFYVLTEERWLPGTSILVSLQIINPANRQIEAMISVQSKVVWLGTDGVGFAFDDDPVHRLATGNVEELVQLKKFLQMIKN